MKHKSDEAAQYFCDDRESNFIEMVFQEIWKFTSDFQRSVKVQ